VVVVAVTVAVKEDPVEDPVAAEIPVVDEDLGAKVDAEAMVQQTAPRTQNYIQAQTITAGLEELKIK
jgi:hypothetical protein